MGVHVEARGQLAGVGSILVLGTELKLSDLAARAFTH